MKSSRVSAKGHTRGELSLMTCNSGRPLANRILLHLNKIIQRDDPGTELELVVEDSGGLVGREAGFCEKDGGFGCAVWFEGDFHESATGFGFEVILHSENELGIGEVDGGEHGHRGPPGGRRPPR